MSNKKIIKKSIAFGIVFVFVMLFTVCNDIIVPPVKDGYGRISVNFIDEEDASQTVRTIFPSKAFDKYVYIFTKAGETDGVEETPDADGLFTLELGDYTVEVKAYIGNTEPYTLAASGESELFSVGSGNNVPVEVRLSAVDSAAQGVLDYTINYPADATAAIILQRWSTPDNTLVNIPLNPIDLTPGVKTENLSLYAGSYILTVLITKDTLYAGINEVVHINPFLSTVYTKTFTDADLLSTPPVVSFNTNGGSDIPDIEVVVGAAVSRPGNPTRNGYTFVDWYSDSALTNVYNFSTPVIGNITLHAMWVMNQETIISIISEYLDTASGGGSPSNPVMLDMAALSIDFSSTITNWRVIFETANEANKYIELDLSSYTASGEFYGYVTTGRDKLVGVILPEGITSIGTYGFSGYRNLTNINLPAGLTSIGYGAFSNCESLAMIELPAGITSIGDWAFASCESLALTELPAGLTYIGDYAFRYCESLALTELPAGLTYIGDCAFFDCRNLALTELELPAGLTSIGERAFEYCYITSVTIPDSVTYIGVGAFKGAGLTEINVASGNPQYISLDGVLYDRAQRTLIQYPAGKAGAFTIPNSVTSIGDYAFMDCMSLALTELPAGITSIGNHAFHFCMSLALTELPAGLTYISDYAFRYCTSLALTELPAGITSIGNSAFQSCTNLALTELPAGITSIGYDAFSGCTSLALTELPAGITSIGERAFQDCTSLAEVICNAITPPALGAGGIFSNTSASLVIRVPAGSVDAYKAAPGWSEYAGRIVAID